MKAIWFGIYDRGIIAGERVHFRATADIDLSRYILLDDVWTGPNNIGNGNRHAFWFPPQPIKAGENVVVYTRAGAASRETRQDGNVYHFIFRQLAGPIYSRPEACAVLYELADWATTLR
jgi:hypothetical protein